MTKWHKSVVCICQPRYNLIGERIMSLKEIRKSFKLSQLDAANIANVPLITYVRYEFDEEYGDELKRKMNE